MQRPATITPTPDLAEESAKLAEHGGKLDEQGAKLAEVEEPQETRRGASSMRGPTAHGDEHRDDGPAAGPFESAIVAGISGAAAAQTFAILGPVGGVVAAATTPLVTYGAGRVVERLHRAIADSRNAVVARSAQECGISIASLMDLLSGDDEKLRVFALVMDAAATTSLQSKLQLMAKILATVATAADRPTIDSERIFLEAVDRVEEPHLLVLHRLSRAFASEEAPFPFKPRLERQGRAGSRAVEEDVLASGFADSPEERSTLQPVLQTLAQLGMIILNSNTNSLPTYDEWYVRPDNDKEPSARDTRAWSLTWFGVRFLHRLGLELPSWEPPHQDPPVRGVAG